MDGGMPHGPLDLTQDPVTLTERLVDIPSVSGDEQADRRRRGGGAARLAHLEVQRFGNTVVARTSLGRPERVVLGRSPRHRPGATTTCRRGARTDVIHGLGSCDMKGGVAVALHLAATVPEPQPRRHLPLLRLRGGRRRAQRPLPARRSRTRTCCDADFAVLLEPSDAVVEAGCQGTLRVDVTRHRRARPLGPVVDGAATRSTPPATSCTGCATYEPRRPVIDGLEYHEGLNAVFVEGGVAGNVVPDRCVVSVNHRFAPDRSEEEALAFVTRVLRAVRRGADRLGPGRAARPLGAGRGRLRRGRRRHREPEVRLDRRGPLRVARRAGGELRPGRPVLRPQAGRARPGRADRAGRARTCGPGWEAAR